MNLSKRKLNKIKVRKDNSRKKKHLRRNKKKFDNSKKKHNKKSHLKNKTLKIYFGGKTDGCEYKDMPFSYKFPAYFTKLSLEKKKDYINTYFDPNKNNICLQEARDQLFTYLKSYYRNTDPKPEDSVLVELKDLWENKLDQKKLSEDQRLSLALDLNDIKGQAPTPGKPVMSDSMRQKASEQDTANLIKLCESIPPINDTNVYQENIDAISNEIKAKSTKSLIAKPTNLIRQVGNIDLYAVETTSEGDCMYSSFIYGLLLKQIGKWNQIPGWKPVKDETSGKCNYLGNLRGVLADYICKNKSQLNTMFDDIALQRAIERIINNKWGEETELKILARMFDVCLAVFKGNDIGNLKNINKNIEFYNKTGQEFTKDEGEGGTSDQDIKNICGNSVVYIIEYGNIHFQSVVPILNPVPPGTPPPPENLKQSSQQKPSSSSPKPSGIPDTSLDNIYPCSVDGINSELPDTEEEALKVLAKLDSILIHCNNESIDKFQTVIEFLEKYINDYETKFGKQPEYITEHCQGLFKGDYDYNIVPDDEEEALNKFTKFLEFIVDQESKPDFNCVGAANMALDIYIKKLEEKYGQDILFKNTMNAPSSTLGDCGDMFKGEMAPELVPNTKEAAIKKLKQYEAMLEKDKNEDGSRCESQITDALNIYKPKMEIMYPVEASRTDATGAPSGTSGPDATGAPSGTSGPEAISNEKIQEIFNFIQSNNEITQNKLIRFLVNKTNEDAILLRHVIGFDEPLTMSQIRETRNIAGKTSWSKNAQIYNSLMTSYEQMQSGGGKNIQKGGYGEMNSEAFTKFVNCGQYRDKSQNTFDCKNVNIPDNSGTSGTSGTFPLATATPVNDKNITLEINENQYSNDIKMVTVHMFVPKESQVIVKDYAKNTESEMISSLPDGLPAPEPIGPPPSGAIDSTSTTQASPLALPA